MPGSANAIGNHSRDADLWIELLKPQHRRGCTPGHRPRIDDQHDRCLEELGNLGSTAYAAGATLAIIESHHPLDHGDLSRGSSPTKYVQHTAGWQHPGIQVVAGPGCGQGEMGRIDIVRSNFEGLHLDASRTHMRDE